MTKPKHKLRRVRVAEISLVDRPAVPSAGIAVLKRAPDTAPTKARMFSELMAGLRTPAPATAGESVTKSDVDKLAERQQALVREIEKLSGHPLPSRVEDSPLVKAAKAAAESAKGGA